MFRQPVLPRSWEKLKVPMRVASRGFRPRWTVSWWRKSAVRCPKVGLRASAHGWTTQCLPEPTTIASSCPFMISFPPTSPSMARSARERCVRRLVVPAPERSWRRVEQRMSRPPGVDVAGVQRRRDRRGGGRRRRRGIRRRRLPVSLTARSRSPGSRWASAARVSGHRLRTSRHSRCSGENRRSPERSRGGRHRRERSWPTERQGHHR